MGEYAEIYTENLALCWFKNYLKSEGQIVVGKNGP